jgi:hypothetical protein
MTYTLTTGSAVIRDSDNAFIPNDPMNSDWIAYQVWLKAGNTPKQATTPPVPGPQSVSKRQFFQAAAQMGLITEAEALAMVSVGAIPASLLAAIGTLPANQQFYAKMLIVGARTFERSSAFVSTLSTAMGLTATQVDALFTLAASL